VVSYDHKYAGKNLVKQVERHGAAIFTVTINTAPIPKVCAVWG
jgi:hypothetical protein